MLEWFILEIGRLSHWSHCPSQNPSWNHPLITEGAHIDPILFFLVLQSELLICHFICWCCCWIISPIFLFALHLWHIHICVKFCVSCFGSKVKCSILSIRSVSCLSIMAFYVVSYGTFCAVSCNVFCICCSSNLKLRRGLCSLTFTLSPSQSSLDQYDGVREGCGASHLQYVHSLRVPVQSLLEMGLTMSILLKLMVSWSCVLYCSLFIGLK